MAKIILKALFLILQIIYLVNGHGRLINPLTRSELCQHPTTKQMVTCSDVNWHYCDFVAFQYYYRSGNCHVCGKNIDDNLWGSPHWSRSNSSDETGPITATYNSGDKISLTARLGSHGGYHRVRLCKLNGKEKVTQECLNQNLLRIEVTDQSHMIYNNKTFQVRQIDSHTIYAPGVCYACDLNSTFNVYLPTGLDCENCVFQWEWHTTDQVNYCRSLSGAMIRNEFNADYNDSPCITQIFRTCADVRIKPIENQPALKQTPFVIKNKEPIFSCRVNRNERSNGPLKHIDTPDPYTNTGHGMICFMSEELHAATNQSNTYLVNTFCPNCYNNCFLSGKTCPTECYCRWYKKYI